MSAIETNAAPRGRGGLNRNNRRAVIVDGDPEHCAMLLKRLAEFGVAVTLAHNVAEGLRLIRRDKPALALLRRDVYGWRGAGGDDAVAAARDDAPQTRVVAMVDQTAGPPPVGMEVAARPVGPSALQAFLADADKKC